MWMWAKVEKRHYTVAELRAGLMAWKLFVAQRPYQLQARAENLVNVRFLKWLGFQVAGGEANDLYLVRDPKCH